MKKVLLYCVLLLTLFSCEESEETYIPVVFPAEFVVHVVFHVDNAVGISDERIDNILEKCNELYNDNGTNIQFELREIVDVDWVGEGLEFDCIEFINSVDNKRLLSNLDENINIFLFPFSQIDPRYVTLGVARMPLTYSVKPLEGLPRVSGVLDHAGVLSSDLRPFCVCINSEFVGVEYESTPTKYESGDVVVTLAHELGHYLGVFHPFTEDIENERNIVDRCEDTDYCDDTFFYNRYAYQQTIHTNYTYDRMQYNPDVSFISHNIMDYEKSHVDEFTADQIGRMQHVLKYSPLIPYVGKNFIRYSRSVLDDNCEIPHGIVME